MSIIHGDMPGTMDDIGADNYSIPYPSTAIPAYKNHTTGSKKVYKVVAGSKSIHVDRGDSQAAFNMFSDITDRETTDGWEYHSMETITVSENSGCLGLSSTSTYYYMLIFSHDVE